MIKSVSSSSALFVTLILLPLLLSAQPLAGNPAVPDNALQAEMAGDWEKARDIYLEILQESPERYDLHKRLADIYATMNQPRAAKKHLKLVLEQSPQDQQLLKSYAELANWVGDYADAELVYERLLALNSDSDKYLMYLARVESWQGKVDQSARHYKDYLSNQPEDRGAYLGYAYTQSWRGDYAHALELAEEYRRLGGEQSTYLRARTRFLARAGQVDAALELAEQALALDPSDYHANFSKTVALKEAGRIAGALASLEQTVTCCEAPRETGELERIVRTPLRHFVTGSLSYADDSDDIETSMARLNGAWVINPGLSLSAGLQTMSMQAPVGSGLEAADGSDSVDLDRAWLGLDYALSDSVWIRGSVGSHDSEVSGSTGVYSLGADYRANDRLRLSIAAGRDFHAVSPRAVSLDITRKNYSVRAIWNPDLRYTVDLQADHASFSDSNERSQLALAVRRSIARTERFNLDIGVSARWFGFAEQFRNGYYNPSNYRQYLLTVNAYFKLSDDNGVSVTFAPGVHKDQSFSSYKTSGNFSIDATFGLYKDWMLNARAGLVNNIGINDRTYRRSEAVISLTRRF